MGGMSLYSVKRELVKLKDKNKTVQIGTGSPVYDCSREDSVFIIVGRGGDMLIFGCITVKRFLSKRSQLTCTHLLQNK